MRSLLAVLLLTSVASAGEPIAFHAPPGWTVDDSVARTQDFSFAAVDDKSGVRMLGKIENEPIAANQDAVDEFMKGAQSGGTRVVETRADFPELAGRKCIRIVFEIGQGALLAHNVGYLIPAGNKTAFLMFVSTAPVEARLAELDRIAGATTLPPPPPSLSYRIGYATGELFGVLAVLGLGIFFIVRASRKPAI